MRIHKWVPTRNLQECPSQPLFLPLSSNLCFLTSPPLLCLFLPPTTPSFIASFSHACYFHSLFLTPPHNFLSLSFCVTSFSLSTSSLFPSLSFCLPSPSFCFCPLLHYSVVLPLSLPLSFLFSPRPWHWQACYSSSVPNFWNHFWAHCTSQPPCPIIAVGLVTAPGLQHQACNTFTFPNCCCHHWGSCSSQPSPTLTSGVVWFQASIPMPATAFPPTQSCSWIPPHHHCCLEEVSALSVDNVFVWGGI